MENASKALIMAGSVLIAIMVISLLVMAYNNLTETMNAKNNKDVVEQVIEFNKQYDVYYRNNLYGSDILSLANKVADYNARQAYEQGYKELDIKVIFTKSISAYGVGKIVEERDYDSKQINEKVQEIEKNIEIYGKAEIARKNSFINSRAKR